MSRHEPRRPAPRHLRAVEGGKGRAPQRPRTKRNPAPEPPATRRAPRAPTPANRRHGRAEPPATHKRRSGAATAAETPSRRRAPAARHAAPAPRRGDGGRPRHPPAERKPLARRAPRRARQIVARFRAGETNRRMKVFFVVSIVLLVAIIARVILLQTTQADSLVAEGRAQRITERILRAKRGALLAANGQALAISVLAPTVTANPKMIHDPEATAATLASILDLSAAKQRSLQASLEAKTKSFVYVARQVPKDRAEAIAALKLTGVDIYDEPTRAHPATSLAGSIIGRTDLDGTGVSGLEKAYQAILAGKDGERTRLRDQHGKTIAGQTVTTPAVPGTDLMLTIDPVLQYHVEVALLQRVNELTARGGTVVVMDTDTGQVKAVANVRRNAKGQVVLTLANVAAVESQAPGSVAKALAIAAVVDQGAVTPESVLAVKNVWTWDKGTEWEHTIRDAEFHGPAMSIREILVKSSNIGTFLAARKIGTQSLNEYHKKFGLGVKTAINFPDESAGALKDWNKLQGSERDTVAYGYGLTVSSLQLVSAMNALANNGLYVAPSLVKASVDALGNVRQSPPPQTRRVVSPDTSATMASMLTDVVCRGTGKQARIPGMSVAGKTGTAYKIQKNGKYVADDGKTRKYFASFVGYLPAQNPQVTILVSIDEPNANSNERFGGTAAAPLFKSVAQLAVHELGVTPVEGDRGCGGSR